MASHLLPKCAASSLLQGVVLNFAELPQFFQKEMLRINAYGDMHPKHISSVLAPEIVTVVAWLLLESPPRLPMARGRPGASGVVRAPEHRPPQARTPDEQATPEWPSSTTTGEQAHGPSVLAFTQDGGGSLLNWPAFGPKSPQKMSQIHTKFTGGLGN